MRISDWSSDVCSSDLADRQHRRRPRSVDRGRRRRLSILTAAQAIVAADQAEISSPSRRDGEQGPGEQEGTPMPYVNIRITREDATAAQKRAPIAGVTELLQRTLGKNPPTPPAHRRAPRKAKE